MNRQSVGLVLCALVLSTLGHEVLQRQHLAHSAKLHHGKEKSHFLARDNPSTETASTTECTEICPCAVTVGINATLEIIWALNITAGSALVLDLKAGLIGVFQASSSSAIIIEVATQKIVIVKGIQIDEKFLISITSLQELYSNGQSTTIASVYVEIQAVLISLNGGAINSSSAQDTLTLVLHIYQQIVVINQYLVYISSGVTVISSHFSLTKFVSVFVGLASILGNVDISGGLQSSGHLLPLSTIVKVKSSFELVLVILGLLDVQVVIKIFNSFSSIEDFIVFLANAAGGNNVGLDAFIIVLKAVILFVNAKISFDEFIIGLIEFYASVGASAIASIAEQWALNIKAVIQLIAKLNIQAQVTEFYNLLIQIQEEALVVAGISISAIIKVLLTATTGVAGAAVGAILLILKLVELKIAFDVAVVRFFLHIILYLAVAGGGFVVKAITGVVVGVETGVAFFLGLLAKINILVIFSANALLNALNSIAVFAQIIVSFNAGLQTPGLNVTTSFGAIIVGGTWQTIVGFIKDIITGKIQLGGSVSVSSGGGVNATSGSNVTVTGGSSVTESILYSSSQVVTASYRQHGNNKLHDHKERHRDNLHGKLHDHKERHHEKEHRV